MNVSSFIINTLFTLCSYELSNTIAYVNNEIIISLKDGTKAKIKAKKIDKCL